jgi:hypothetical protein
MIVLKDVPGDKSADTEPQIPGFGKTPNLGSEKVSGNGA